LFPDHVALWALQVLTLRKLVPRETKVLKASRVLRALWVTRVHKDSRETLGQSANPVIRVSLALKEKLDQWVQKVLKVTMDSRVLWVLLVTKAGLALWASKAPRDHKEAKLVIKETKAYRVKLAHKVL
jgi:hypothetical protein